MRRVLFGGDLYCVNSRNQVVEIGNSDLQSSKCNDKSNEII